MMLVISSCIHTGASAIPKTHDTLVCARLDLFLASSLAEKYYLTWHSITWVKSNAQTKGRMKLKLNHIAYDSYSYFCSGLSHLDAYCELMDNEQRRVPKWWCKAQGSLGSAYELYHKGHQREINNRQLNLID